MGSVPENQTLSQRTLTSYEADQWGNSAATLAHIAGDPIGGLSVERWLDAAESSEVKRLRTESPPYYTSLRNQATIRAISYSNFLSSYEYKP